MAQSAVTVTPENPTPPTNFSFTGAMPPNAPNFTKLTYTNYVGVGLVTAQGSPGAPPAPLGLWSAVVNPPPYYDDGSAGTATVFAANTAALASGTGATSGGTENTFPGTGASGNFQGAVPASSSVAHEGAGNETLFTASYNTPQILVPVPLTTVGCGPTQTAASILAGPNANHASTLSPTTAPTLTSLGTPSSASGASGTYSQTVTGTGFTRQSVIYVNGVAQTTTFNSATSLTAPTVTKKTSAGTWPVTVVTGGSITTAAQTWTFT